MPRAHDLLTDTVQRLVCSSKIVGRVHIQRMRIKIQPYMTVMSQVATVLSLHHVNIKSVVHLVRTNWDVLLQLWT